MMRDNVYNDHQLENLEERLLDLRGTLSLPLGAYSEDDDSVTRVLELPQAAGSEGAADWLVALSQRDQRSLTTEQVRRGLAYGELRPDLLVWRRGLPTWQRLGSVAELRPVHVAAECVAGSSPGRAPPRAAAPAAPPSEPRMSEPSARAGAESTAEASPTAERASLVPPNIDLESLSAECGSLRVKRAVMGVSALTMTAVFVTLFALSATGDDKVREAARQREAAAALEARSLEGRPLEGKVPRRRPAPEPRTTAPDSVQELETEPDEERPARRSAPRERARGVPSGAAAMMLGSEE